MPRTAFYGTVMTGGRDHGQLHGATRVASTRTAPAYRLWTNQGRYPLLQRDEVAGGSIACEVWDVPDDVFMVMVMDQPKMKGVSGLAKYRQEFSSVYKAPSNFAVRVT
jgi:gamma-glutamylcyclotransferase (GGCT)/AIG2-like uncharacterized protein YtfP